VKCAWINQIPPPVRLPLYCRRLAAPQRMSKVYHSTKSLRDSPLRGVAEPRARCTDSAVAVGASCLEDRGVCKPHSRQELTDDYRDCQPVAPAHDRGHELAPARSAHAAQPHLQLQAICGVSEALPGHGDMRGYPQVPTLPGRDRHEHLQSQPHHDRGALPVPRNT